MEENVATQTIVILKRHIQDIENGIVIPTIEDLEELKTFFQYKKEDNDKILSYLFKGWYMTECMGK